MQTANTDSEPNSHSVEDAEVIDSDSTAEDDDDEGEEADDDSDETLTEEDEEKYIELLRRSKWVHRVIFVTFRRVTKPRIIRIRRMRIS